LVRFSDNFGLRELSSNREHLSSQEEEESLTEEVLEGSASSSCDYVVAAAAGPRNKTPPTTDNDSFLSHYASVQERDDKSKQVGQDCMREEGDGPNNIFHQNMQAQNVSCFRRICMVGSLRRVDEVDENG
jgi:hypothetical protein